ncbi:pre-mRNA-splicing factor 18 [Cryptococcus bacillisporus CA1873]|uniref:Pre-mRNA-splicing factor 18 n=1 Tax=Cryptococcus bacillisporus CA1873 TaxID=1296111 RepID=A0ABR5BCB8_CRYGA|nr:pre-mRNA-splicing factor 18 [Cryptococcus bacillisporus CA1873]|eukprot:KIR63958.1 pre-mRNA-splicing factor 18 [Cryptococcus gattii CA1873]
MDALLAEISAKRKALEVDEGDGGAKKYMRRADIERMREEEERRKKEEERKEKEAKKAQEAKEKAAKVEARHSALARVQAASPSSSRSTPDLTIPSEERFNISPEECIRRLRQKGQPIRLFGESDKDRRLRLRALELLEERGPSGGQGRNDFMKALEEMESGLDKKDVERKARELHRLAEERGRKEGSAASGEGDSKEVDGKESREDKKKKGVDMGILDLKLIKTDPNKLYPIIYYALKGVLKEWEEWMDNRPEEIRRSTQGKLAAANQVQSAQSLKPLFRSLRSRDLAPDVLRLLAEIVHHMQSRAYQKANDAYLRLSIGNAAWPIGVTSVGIHERSAREKIGQDNIAHVLNDEVTRKYIQAVKRLLTFSQTIRPPEDVSQLMG